MFNKKMVNKKPFSSFDRKFNQSYFAISEFPNVFIGIRNNASTVFVSVPTIRFVI